MIELPAAESGILGESNAVIDVACRIWQSWMWKYSIEEVYSNIPAWRALCFVYSPPSGLFFWWPGRICFFCERPMSENPFKIECQQRQWARNMIVKAVRLVVDTAIFVQLDVFAGLFRYLLVSFFLCRE